MDKDVIDGDESFVTVLMCVYNGEQFISGSVKSILAQTFKNLEFLIIDDGSTDRTVSIISSFDDQRIRLVHNEKNEGLIASLNKGISLSKGNFIARMDADDIADEQRLSKQLIFFKNNPGVGVCGSWMKIIDTGNLYQLPLQHEEIKVAMLFSNPMAHPTVMFNKKFIAKDQLYYDEEYKDAEDYELWPRLIFKTLFANIPEPLVGYRVHPQQVTQSRKEVMLATTQKIKLNFLKNFEIVPTEREKKVHLFLFDDFYDKNDISVSLDEADRWLYKLFEANKKLGILNDKLFNCLWQKKIFISMVPAYNLRIWKLLASSLCFKYAAVEKKDKIKLFIKCLLNQKKN